MDFTQPDRWMWPLDWRWGTHRADDLVVESGVIDRSLSRPQRDHQLNTLDQPRVLLLGIVAPRQAIGQMLAALRSCIDEMDQPPAADLVERSRHLRCDRR